MDDYERSDKKGIKEGEGGREEENKGGTRGRGKRGRGGEVKALKA